MRPGVGLGWVWLGGRPRALAGAVVGNFDTDMRLICREGLSESFLLTWGERACVRRAKDCGPG